jgi:predicted N-acyltransferase
MEITVIDHLAEVDASAWNTLAGDDNPFLRYEFLDSLERSGCVGGESGWQPQHLLARVNNGSQRLLGAVPLYLKHHSYGEYVFDWAWADAYARAGLEYYPKLVAAVPFTPATGNRILVDDDADSHAVAGALSDGARAHAERIGASSLHWLFTPEAQTDLLERRGLMRRVGNQFHWRNHGFRDFGDFLAAMSAAKRKKIKRERRRVADAGVVVEVRGGGELGERDWDMFYRFYLSTIRSHGAMAYLNREFFLELGRRMPERIVMTLALHNGRQVAAALNLLGRDTLYGRYWGALEDFHSLHFETCYYRAIEYCIEQGLERFEAGAQGEHKLSRGFLPTPTYSAHWLRHPQFSRAVADYLAREREGMAHYAEELDAHSPFRAEAAQ